MNSISFLYKKADFYEQQSNRELPPINITPQEEKQSILQNIKNKFNNATDLVATKTKNGILKQQLKEQSDNADEWKSRHANVFEELNKTKSSLDDLEASKMELEARLKRQIGALRRLKHEDKIQNKQQVMALENQINHLSGQISAHSKTISNYKQQLKSAEEIINDNTQDIIQKENTIKTLKTTLDGHKEEIVGLNKRLDEHKNTIEELTKTLGKTETSNKYLKWGAGIAIPTVGMGGYLMGKSSNSTGGNNAN